MRPHCDPRIERRFAPVYPIGLRQMGTQNPPVQRARPPRTAAKKHLTQNAVLVQGRRMGSTTIVTGGDAGYYPLIEELAQSVRDRRDAAAVGLAVIDGGLTAEQKAE